MDSHSPSVKTEVGKFQDGINIFWKLPCDSFRLTDSTSLS